MENDELAASLQKYTGFELNAGQRRAAKAIGRFLLSALPKPSFILSGYAGTGKTSLVAALVKTLPAYGLKAVMLAPTGRAAKVISLYSKKKAFTIHRHIFTLNEYAGGGKTFTVKPNRAENTLYIVDEASMINDERSYGQNGLLEELLDFVFYQPGSGNRVLFVGDAAQLPPVHYESSPALDLSYLAQRFGLDAQEAALTEVARQQLESGILFNATRIRALINQGGGQLVFHTKGYKDIFKMTSEKLEDGLRYAYNKFGVPGTVIVCRSNKSANQYNQYIRRQIFFSESEIDAGDLVMSVKNDYHWIDPTSPVGFLANGEFLEVMKVIAFDEAHGHRFVKLGLRLPDYPKQEPFEAWAHLGTLHSNHPRMEETESKKLRDDIIAEYMEWDNKEEAAKAMAKDPYLNALQIKFAYAITCHKSQGGQWAAVFVDQGYLKDGGLDKDFLRWVYTGVTRAVSELFLVNFLPAFFGGLPEARNDDY